MKSILTEIYCAGNLIFNTTRYVLGLSLPIKKKNCSEMARAMEVTHDAMQRTLEKSVDEMNAVREELHKRARLKIQKTRNGALICDSSVAIKEHAKKIEGVSRQYVGSKTKPGISLTATLWTDMQGNIEPVDLFVWQKGDRPKKQTAIERNILLAQTLGVDTILMDADFATYHAFESLQNTGLTAVMRFHSNRVVDVEGFGKAQLKNHPAFKFQRNVRRIVRSVSWHGLSLCVIALKIFRKQKGWFILYLVTNTTFKKALRYAEFYKHRWQIEPFFRTSKQNYGLGDCMARSIKTQEAHFLAVLLAYSDSKCKNPTIPKAKSTSRKELVPIQHKIRSLKLAKPRKLATIYACA